jgi:hypothetical protein
VRIILKNVKNPTRLSANYATTSFGIGTATSQGYKIDYSNTSKKFFLILGLVPSKKLTGAPVQIEAISLTLPYVK